MGIKASNRRLNTRGIRPVVVAAALVLAAVAVLVGTRRSERPHVTETHVSGVPTPASAHDAGSIPRPGMAPSVDAVEAVDRALAPASPPATGESPDLYATGTAHVPAEAQVEAPTSPSPELLYDEVPTSSPYDSPTDSQSGVRAQQWPVSEPYDRAPTEMPFDTPAEPGSDPALDSQDSSPTEAPPD